MEWNEFDGFFGIMNHSEPLSLDVSADEMLQKVLL